MTEAQLPSLPAEEPNTATDTIPGDKKFENPSALDVIQALIDPNQEEKASAHMKGHISKSIIDDTFLYEAKEIYPESTLRINCQTHDAPATFYSKAEQRYKCLKCIVASEDLHYIDKKYKNQLEEFEQIKSMTAKAIVENEQHISIIHNWKEGIRDTLVKVKNEYIEWIESFTNKFVKSLNKIEQSRELIGFVGEDKKQELRLIEVQNKYHEILKIFFKIQQTKPDDKLVTIQSFREEMLSIQQFVVLKDKEIKKQAIRVDKASRETVDLDGLAIKIFSKYLKFLQNKVLEEQQRQELERQGKPPAGASSNSTTKNNATSDDLGGVSNAGSSIHMSEYPIERAAHTVTKAKQYANQVASAAAKSSPNVDLDMSMASVSSRFRHENQNSIYYLQQKSCNIFMLDFEQKGFVKEQLKFKRGGRVTSLPEKFTSVQTTDASIFVIGGSRTIQAGAQPSVLPDTLMVDCNMGVYERSSMQSGRFHVPLALIRDRFILALGGQTSRSSSSKSAECFDTQTNHWFPIAALPTTSVNTTAIVMNERWVYLMPGGNREAQAGNALCIQQLDTGSQSQFEGNKNSREYGQVIARMRWVQLEVSNSEFVRAQPCSGIQLNNTDMLIFGGETKQCFIFDTREVQQANKQATVKTHRSQMTSRARFGHQSDWVGRTFGTFIYTVDACENNLNVFDITNNSWSSFNFSQLKLPSA